MKATKRLAIHYYTQT